MSIFTQFAQMSDSYNSYSNMEPTSDSAAAAIVGTAFLIFALIFAIIIYVVYAFLLGRIFKKAGVDQWIAWVPIYNSWKMLEIGGQQGFWAIVSLIPFIGIIGTIFMYIAMYNIGLKLQKEGWFVLLAIFVPIVWMVWLAFDSSKWAIATPGAVAPDFVAPKTDETPKTPPTV